MHVDLFVNQSQNFLLYYSLYNGLYLCDTLCLGYFPSLAAGLLCASSIVGQPIRTAVDLIKVVKDVVYY